MESAMVLVLANVLLPLSVKIAVYVTVLMIVMTMAYVASNFPMQDAYAILASRANTVSLKNVCIIVHSQMENAIIQKEFVDAINSSSLHHQMIRSLKHGGLVMTARISSALVL